MKIGLIGCGSIAQVHAKSISTIGKSLERDLELENDYRLAAVADCELSRAERMAQEYGATPYQDWMEMLEREKPDIVHICTPHYLHTPMAVAALQRGIHVFMEKPPVVSWEQLECLRAAVQGTSEQGMSQGTAGQEIPEQEVPARGTSEQGVSAQGAAGRTRLAICFQNRFNPSVQYVKNLLQGGKLGKIKGLRGFVTWYRDGAYYANSPWRGSLEKEGGGALINQGIHTLDLMQYLVGCAPIGVDAALNNFHLKGQIEVEDTLTACIQYSEARAVFYVTTAYAADVQPIIELECEHGRVRIEGDEVSVWGEDGSLDRKAFPPEKGFGKSYWGAGHRAAIEGFYASIEKKEPYLLDFDRVEESVKLTLQIYEKARNLK